MAESFAPGFAAVFLLLQIAAAPPTACGDAELSALQRAREIIARGGEPVDLAGTCLRTQIANLALRAWRQARALAPKGAPPDLTAPVRETVVALTALGPLGDQQLEVEYAVAAINAAIAAAQDERPEMELWLTHARDLAERLIARGRVAVWPRSYNLLAGELWFEVDRYEDARAAYERAVRGDASPVALVGLARAQARLGMPEACTTYRRANDMAPALRAATAGEFMRCK